jgi:hypothetical protein
MTLRNERNQAALPKNVYKLLDRREIQELNYLNPCPTCPSMIFPLVLDSLDSFKLGEMEDVRPHKDGLRNWRNVDMDRIHVGGMSIRSTKSTAGF